MNAYRDPHETQHRSLQSGARATHSAPAVALAGQRARFLPETTPAPAPQYQEPAAFSEGWGG